MALLLLFGESSQDCYIEDKSSSSSSEESDITCTNMTVDGNLGEINKNLFKDAETITLQNAKGDLTKNIFKTAEHLKGLLIYKSDIGIFEPEADTIKTLQIHHSQFKNNTNFDKCCKRLTKLLLRTSNGFFLEKSIFENLKRLEKLELSHQSINNLTKSVFKGLRSLKKLRISESNFKKVDGDAFEELTELKELYIDETSIQELHKDLLKPLKKLKVLNIINGNQLKPLTLDMMNELKNLRHLGLPLNSWKNIDIEKITKVLPNLYSYSYSGDWKTREEKIFFREQFKKLNDILYNRHLS